MGFRIRGFRLGLSNLDLKHCYYPVKREVQMTFGPPSFFCPVNQKLPSPKTSDTPPVTDTAIETPAEVVPPDIEDSDIGEGELYPEEEPTFRHKKRMRIEHIKTRWFGSAMGGMDRQYGEQMGRLQ